ncbi:MAG: PEP/pyruvate-binding domain-containing protein [Verrucomicrobiales bacterium]
MTHPHLLVSASLDGKEDELQKLGGKARGLAALEKAGFPVPPWLALSSEAIAYHLQGANTPQEYIERCDTFEPPEDLQRALQHHYETWKMADEDHQLLAVRSSALAEDGAKDSFAGQYDSFLFVHPAHLWNAIREVWASAWGERVILYRQERGLPPDHTPPAVIIQKMVHARTAGVVFSSDPVTGRRRLTVVSAVWGAGSGLVNGDLASDYWEVFHDGSIERAVIAEKTEADTWHAKEGLFREAVPEEHQNEPSLTDEEVREVARFARAAAKHFGAPQDVEWVKDHKQFWIVQSRPITTLKLRIDPDAPSLVWDNSNIAESFTGVTTPLTFSFARHVYEEAYRQFCLLVGTPRRQIEEAGPMFSRMLGLIQGRVYYNLLYWYRTLALLPGFGQNKNFMEQMMGVDEPLPADALHLIEKERSTGLFNKLVMFRSTLLLIGRGIGLGGRSARFMHRLGDALEAPSIPLAEQEVHELLQSYEDLEQKLLRHWDAPILNDFLAMIFFGWLRKLCEKHGAPDGEHNRLVAVDGEIISSEPPRRIQEMARLVRERPDLAEALKKQDTQLLQADKDLWPRLDAYLQRFGDRCLGELKMEAVTLHDDPALLYSAIVQSAEREEPERPPLAQWKAEAEDFWKTRLKRNPFDKWLFFWVLGRARSRLRQRENLRFERTRVFGRVRRIFRALGARLTSAEVLEQPEDVYYLTVDELTGISHGTTVSWQLKPLIRVRREEFAKHQTQSPPPRRLITKGPLLWGQNYKSDEILTDDLPRDSRSGLGCSPGVIEGIVRVVRDPREAHLQAGEILVAERTDPGWIMLFPMASALVVEHGSLLSHSAIVSRELGLTSVVGVPKVTHWLHTGDRIRVSGDTGRVDLLEEAEGSGTLLFSEPSEPREG